MCKRTERDPLLRLFLDQYNLHLLTVPRENAAVGDLYVHDGRRAASPGSVTHFLTPEFTMPPVSAGERMADVAGTLSGSVDISAGLGLLEGFLTALGAGGVLTKTKAEFAKSDARALRFRFAEATRDSVDPLLLGSELGGHTFMQGNALYDERSRYYLVTAAVRSPSISVIAENERAARVDLDVEALKLAEAAVGVSIKMSAQRELTFAGPKTLAFGVELYEMSYEQKRGKMRLSAPEGAGRVRGPGKEPLPEPAFIGGPEGDVFLEVQ